jgi:hypothetical protein
MELKRHSLEAEGHRVLVVDREAQAQAKTEEPFVDVVEAMKELQRSFIIEWLRSGRWDF